MHPCDCTTCEYRRRSENIRARNEELGARPGDPDFRPSNWAEMKAHHAARERVDLEALRELARRERSLTLQLEEARKENRNLQGRIERSREVMEHRADGLRRRAEELEAANARLRRMLGVEISRREGRL